MQSALFHLANISFIIGYLFPYGNLYINIAVRLFFIIGSLFSSYWAWNIICSPELFGWNFLYVIINMAQLLFSLYKVGPPKLIQGLNQLYILKFQPLNIDKIMFLKLVNSNMCSIHNMRAGETYALKNFSLSNKLSILLKGRITVFDKEMMLYHIYPYEFLDATEYQSFAGNDDHFQVSLFASQESMYICWERKIIEQYFVKHPELRHSMKLLMSNDTIVKMYRLNKQVRNKYQQNIDIRLQLMSSLFLKPEKFEAKNFADRDNEKFKECFMHCINNMNEPGYQYELQTNELPIVPKPPSRVQKSTQFLREGLKNLFGFETSAPELVLSEDLGEEDNFTFADLLVMRKKLRMQHSVRLALNLPTH